MAALATKYKCIAGETFTCVHPCYRTRGLALNGSAQGQLVVCGFLTAFHSTSPGDYKSTFIKTGAVKQGLSIEEATGEPRWGCLSSLGSQRRRSPWDRFRGSALSKLLLPIVPLIASLQVPYNLGDAQLLGKKRGKGMVQAAPKVEINRIQSCPGWCGSVD